MLKVKFKDISNDSFNLERVFVLLLDRGLTLTTQILLLDKKYNEAISSALREVNFKEKFKGDVGEHHTIFAYDEYQNVTRFIFYGVGKEGNHEEHEVEKIGAQLYNFLKSQKIEEATVMMDRGLSQMQPGADANLIASGAMLASYSFDKYKSEKKPNIYPKELTIAAEDKETLEKFYFRTEAMVHGTFLARDLINEPPNVLYPESYAKVIEDELEPLGIKVNILGEKEMEELGMGALLGVGQGSRNESKLVTMEYRGAVDDPDNHSSVDDAPVAFVGKGVTFDTGGISLKPAGGMEEMKYDMAGSAAVVGAMKSLAMRKAKINAVGVVALAENMPGGNAQRPSDIVKTMSGQTVEVLNTDAEGRLILADALTYTQKTFKPIFIVDLATLTGAMVISLAHIYAGLFSNNDKFADKLFAAGILSGEKLWRMPLHKDYDKMIDSPVADMKNIGGRGAGSITAAQFLQRFVTDSTWAHLDIAGVAWSKEGTDRNPKGPVGFGVKLLDRFVYEYYEPKRRTL